MTNAFLPQAPEFPFGEQSNEIKLPPCWAGSWLLTSPKGDPLSHTPGVGGSYCPPQGVLSSRPHSSAQLPFHGSHQHTPQSQWITWSDPPMFGEGVNQHEFLTHVHWWREKERCEEVSGPFSLSIAYDNPKQKVISF